MTNEVSPSMSENAAIKHVTHSHDVVFVRAVSDVDHVPVDVELSYATSDPFAIKACFLRGTPNEIDWLFSRELLAAGLLAPAGEGDVRVGPSLADPQRVQIDLKTPDGAACFTVGAEDLKDMLDCSHAVVPHGEEFLWIDFDFELHRLVSG
ncbi:sporulation and cell division protein SsgA [Amycolatopsis orientalis]|uniref:Sporulation and cell division protein SsgA n=1 Tax=Amycolatopsis orientalis TaxID=31958 RepID=A0A193BUU9_AMYOR|nr:SsgA family sporulation/cell division regulator [Amycolatopsis orientalis]ANN15996.1 sporulation and cell division protein SsgA [Amycolatopsis orientalis]